MYDIAKAKKKKKASTLNKRKSWDWIPTFGHKSLNLKKLDFINQIDRSETHGWPITPNLAKGITRVQLVVDAEPEWFDKKAHKNSELALAMIEHSVNVLDLVYV